MTGPAMSGWKAALAAGVLVAGCAVSTAPSAWGSAQSFCGELGGDFDGRYCHTTVTSVRKADRDIRMAIPGDLVDNAVSGPVVRDYLRTLYNNWREKGADMVQDSWGEENYQQFGHQSAVSVVFHEDYHADGPKINNAYRTFTFDTALGRQLQLTDIVKAGLDPLAVIPPLAEPFVAAALDRAAPPHQPGTYPFTVDRWTPDKVYSGGYKAWALTPSELILYLPDYPVAHDNPINYEPGMPVWSMDGGAVEAHIPIDVLAPVLRSGYGG
ncbi:hypothetical protein NJB18091_37660 [Mycobacterium marinum]|uniref:Conserved secreted protein n=1 Tax=Mycobacterium liflandii (strain 128FXT) TaxID=459424 RepID=L7V4C3_MYCL1|nr:conserved secreted protein [Mycobacterium liflandii 128FXT]RFZ64059.1 Mannan-binding protein [Mycobacterium marinum]GJO02528.1 hypothetical protein NJB18091_37660 [Mycobacterium marinum]GJO33023.1 hypothetical protein NJB1507_44420 [Mycobacterium marinum]